ncbi:hypothetical protein [Stakelama tenebrarum]|uniref:Lipoprotein n=1 Tax=Stakelama tenebrarum TaxID=2711215 RepID=A0A6G6Y163_9SPHN|nr:hypothetical protein [Sphingosinithalassobacter tenebrarum]QIG78639.1 hypothetical protein G5C33_01785 [Sphingosinithalassobacter tenebrarum]
MMRFLLLPLVLVVSGCDGASQSAPNRSAAIVFDGYDAAFPLAPPEAYQRKEDRLMVERDPEATPCLSRNADGQTESRPTDQCFVMLDQARFSGVWLDAYEASMFFPDVRELPAFSKFEEGWWVNRNFDGGPALDPARPHVYRIEFIGRRTRHAGMYGHLGTARHEVYADRILSIDEIPYPENWAEAE